MKWIKSRSRFINEAKIKDVVLPRQAKEISYKWGENYLEYEEVEPTNKIKQGKWKLSEEDKLKALSVFFNSNFEKIFNDYNSFSEKFKKILSDSIDLELYQSEKYKIIMNNFNIDKPTIDQFSLFYDGIFKKLSVNDTKSAETIQKDKDGRPIRDEEGNMLKIKKEPGAPIYEKNLVNIRGFIENYNRCYDDDKQNIDIFDNNDFQNFISLSKENHNQEFKIDFEIFNKDIYLSINHKASQILNMSISTFYSSCQHLYSGGYRNQLLGNVFDPNSIPAFLIFDTPIFWKNEKIADFLPLSRMIIRNIEDYENKETNLYFDRSYPDRMKDLFDKLVEKYSENKTNYNLAYYYYTPDIDINDELDSPYMDRMRIKRIKYIGKNTKRLNLSRYVNWQDIRISPNAKIKEMIIETEKLPENLNDLNIKTDWIKFRYMSINNLEPFEKFVSDKLSFDKCKLNNINISDIKGIKSLQIISCDLEGGIDLNKFESIEELQLIYTLDNIDELKNITGLEKIKKLTISGDLVSNKKGKEIISNMKKNMNINISIVGPKL